MQAASQERRRLSGEMQRSAVLEEGPSRTIAQAPLVAETSELSESRSYQPYYQPPTYQDRLEHVVTSPSVSASRLLNDGHPLPIDYSMHSDEPPAKRRRSSGEPQVAINVIPVPQDKPVVPSPPPSPLPIVPSEDPPPKSPVMQSEDVVQRFAPPSAPPQEKPAETPIEPVDMSRPEEIRQDSVEVKVEVNVEPSGRDEKEKGKKEKKERKTAKTSGKPKGKDLSQVTTEPAKQELSERVSQEQDPHQWLLEHYTSPTAPAPSLSLSHPPPPPADQPMATDTGRESAQHESKCETKGESKPASRGSKHKEKKPELVIRQITPAPAPTSEIDIELELATATTPTHVEAKREDPNEMDVDDELLSLVDDKPQPPHVPLQQPTPLQPHGPSHSAHLKPSSIPKSGRLASSRSPSVAPTGLKSERGSMPPPPATSTPGPSREDVKTTSKLVDSSTSASASSSKKKDPVAKVPPFPFVLFQYSPLPCTACA